MLTVFKGPTCYKDIKDVDGKVLDSFRDACFEMRFLEDDNEYVATINQAKDLGFSHFLRKLFVTMLLSSTIINHIMFRKELGVLYVKIFSINKETKQVI